MTRNADLAQLNGNFDVLVVGGGATGLGIAVDAVTRGYRTALVEAGDFAQATSSRATKLVHGGVRYFASGQIHLVYEALRERKVMLTSAPHLVHPLPFLIPVSRWFDLPYFGAGLKLYDLLSGSASMGPTRLLTAESALKLVPMLETSGLRGGVLYHDGQFDDARFALALARTAVDHGAIVANYTRCVELLKQDGKLTGAIVEDRETGSRFTLQARAVINATGIFVDSLRQQDEPAKPALLSLSRGTHIVVDADVLGGGTAIMVPKTSDGRVIFAIPWLGKVVIGTTDLPAGDVAIEAGYARHEIDFLIETINPFLARKIGYADVRSIFSGLRPLVTGSAASTAKLSREHFIDVSGSGLITIAGGKWTTYRRMAEDTLNYAISRKLIPKRECVTSRLKLHGTDPSIKAEGHLSRYGSDAAAVIALQRQAGGDALLDAELPFTVAEVVYAVRHEMSRTVEDVLSRRMRALLLDARAALRAAPAVANVMAAELGRDIHWIQQQADDFTRLVTKFYTLPMQAK